MPQLTESATLYQVQPPFLPKKELKYIYRTKNRTRTPKKKQGPERNKDGTKTEPERDQDTTRLERN